MTIIERNARIMDAMRAAGVEAGRIELRGDDRSAVHFDCGNGAVATLSRISEATDGIGFHLGFVCLKPNTPSFVTVVHG